jgi:hypothetical protein
MSEAYGLVLRLLQLADEADKLPGSLGDTARELAQHFENYFVLYGEPDPERPPGVIKAQGRQTQRCTECNCTLLYSARLVGDGLCHVCGHQILAERVRGQTMAAEKRCGNCAWSEACPHPEYYILDEPRMCHFNPPTETGWPVVDATETPCRRWRSITLVRRHPRTPSPRPKKTTAG